MRLTKLPVCMVLAGTVIISGCAATTSPSGNEGSGAVEASSQTVARTDERERARLHTQLAALYLQEGKSSIALEETRIAIASDPSYAPAYSVAALTRASMGEKALAEEHFKKAMSLAPGDPEINNNYGWYLCQNGRANEAMPLFLGAARNPLYQTPDRAYLNAGLCSLKSKDYTSTEDYFQRALGLSRSNPTALLGLATLYYRTDKMEEANKILAELKRLVDFNAEALWLQLRVSKRLGDEVGERIAASQLRRQFRASPEYQAYVEGRFD